MEKQFQGQKIEDSITCSPPIKHFNNISSKFLINSGLGWTSCDKSNACQGLSQPGCGIKLPAPGRPGDSRTACKAVNEYWRRPDLNRRPSGCKPDALPTELRPRGAFQFPIFDCQFAVRNLHLLPFSAGLFDIARSFSSFRAGGCCLSIEN